MKVICASKENAEIVTRVLGSVFLSSTPKIEAKHYAQLLYSEDLIGDGILEYIERGARIPKEAVRTEDEFNQYGKNVGTKYTWTWYEVKLGDEKTGWQLSY